MKEQGLEAVEIEAFQADPGHGIEAKAAGHKLLIGTRKLLQKHHIQYEQIEASVTTLEEQGKTAMLVAIDGEVAGIVAVADTIKVSSPQAIARLKEQGIHVVMMTGDNKLTAEAIAKQAGIDHVIAEVLPAEKAAHITALKEQGKKSPWSETVSMMPQLLQQRILGWLWEQGQTLPWKQQILRS